MGHDADLTIVDIKRKETLTNDKIASRASWTPYENANVTGVLEGTVVRGLPVTWKGQFVMPGLGQPTAFQECLPDQI